MSDMEINKTSYLFRFCHLASWEYLQLVYISDLDRRWRKSLLGDPAIGR
jgi:hypothetical protein